MPALSFLSFQQIVQASGAAAQAAAIKALDLTVGSIARAILEANAAIAGWVQYLVVLTVQSSRLTTSVGPDVDTWVGDFTLTRLPAVAATGFCDFSRAGTNFPALLPVGTTAITTDGTQSFSITADPTNAAYSSALGGYVIAIGTALITVPVVALTLGSAGNVASGAISLLTSAIPGVDTVTNELPLSNGQDAESDAALKLRFTKFLAGLSEATEAAVGSAVLSVQPGLTYEVAENVAADGVTPQLGHFVLTVDDGSGTPPQALLNAVYAAVDQVRALGITFNVSGPVVTRANITVTITTATGVSHAVAQGIVAQALTDYVDGLAVGAALPYSLLAKLVYDALPTGQITNVSSILLNNGMGDGASITPGPTGVIRVGLVVVN